MEQIRSFQAVSRSAGQADTFPECSLLQNWSSMFIVGCVDSIPLFHNIPLFKV